MKYVNGDGHEHEFFDNWPSETHCAKCGVSRSHLMRQARIAVEARRIAAASTADSEAALYA